MKNVAQLNLAPYYLYFPTPTVLFYNEDDMDDETTPIINFSHHFDDSTNDTEIITDDSSVERDAPPILQKTMTLASRHKIGKQTIKKHNLEQSPHAETMFNTPKIEILADMEI